MIFCFFCWLLSRTKIDMSGVEVINLLKFEVCFRRLLLVQQFSLSLSIKLLERFQFYVSKINQSLLKDFQYFTCFNDAWCVLHNQGYISEKHVVKKQFLVHFIIVYIHQKTMILTFHKSIYLTQKFHVNLAKDLAKRTAT